MRTRRWALVLVGVLLLGQAVETAWITRDNFIHRTLWLEFTTAPMYLAAVALLAFSRLSGRRALVAVVLTGAALQICAIQGMPISSDDDFRYVWDAKVQLHGVDPYRYPPSAPELRHLRDGFLFPDQGQCNEFPGGCTVINRPTVRTIYPPVAEAAFDAVYVLSFGDKGHHVPLQIAAALGAVGVALLLARRGPPAWRVALWSWCPVTIVELGNNAHIDWLGVLFAVLALQLYAGRRFGWAGALVGLATAVKIYPALIGVAMLRRRPVRVVATAVGVVALSYLPHVLAVGGKVLGYLPAYLKEERYESGGRYLLFHGFWSASTTQRVVVVLLALVAVLVLVRSDPDRPERGAAVMVGAAFALILPDQSWYSTLLIALVAMTGYVELLVFPFATTLLYLADGDFGTVLDRDARIARYAFLLFVAVLAVRLLLVRSRSTRTA